MPRKRRLIGFTGSRVERDYNVFRGYIPSFVQHLRSTRARLGLRIGLQESRDWTDTGDVIEELAEAHTHCTRWTPAEHNAFFRALSVHSRWRPDLVAACVPTKTKWEVWMYMEALEEGAAKLATQQGGKDVDMEHGSEDELLDMDMQVDGSSSGSRSHSGLVANEDGDWRKPALEVSPEWIDMEERIASWIAHNEHLESIDRDDGADTEDVYNGPSKQGQDAQSQVQRRTISNANRRSIPPDRHSSSSKSTSTTPPAHECEALMRHLKVSHLLALDGVLREGEEEMLEKSKSRENSVTTTTPTEHEDEGACGVEMQSDQQMTTQGGTTSNCESPSNEPTDPVLLAFSGHADSTGRRISSEGPPTSTPAPLSVPSQSGRSNLLEFPPGNAPLANPDQTANVEPDLSVFSPRSRRRFQKRFYMRRKRALLHNKDPASESNVYAGIERLKPGRPGRRAKNKTVSTSVPCSVAPSDVDEKSLSSSDMAERGEPDSLRPHRLKTWLIKSGIDVAYLRDQGMDLLHLGALGRLMGFYSSLEGADESMIMQSIDAQLVQHLQAAVVSFVTDVIHRAIVWREREVRLKQRSRAWRHGNQITTSAVEHAVRAICARYHSHREYFQSLGAFHGLSSEPSPVPANTSEEPNTIDEPDVGVADRSTEPLGLSPHRDMYTPLICPPSAWGIRPLAGLTRTYEQEVKRTRRGASVEEEEEELMSHETDDEALVAELKEEEEMDALDMQLAAADEEALWSGLEFR